MFKIICNHDGEVKELKDTGSNNVKVFTTRQQAEKLVNKLNSNSTERYTWHIVEE